MRVRFSAGLDRCITKRTKHCVDTRLITRTLGFEPLQNVCVDSQRNRCLGRYRLETAPDNAAHYVSNGSLRVLRGGYPRLAFCTKARPISFGFG